MHLSWKVLLTEAKMQLAFRNVKCKFAELWKSQCIKQDAYRKIHVNLIRWHTSALRMPNDTPNFKPYLEFLNLTPNSWTSLRILEPHSEFLNLTPNSWTSLRIQKHHSEFKTTHSEFKNLTLNSKIWLRILEPHSKFQNLTPNSKTSLRIKKNSLRIPKPHFEFKKCTSNLKTHSEFKNSLRIQKSHSKFLNLTPNSKISLQILQPHSDSELRRSSFNMTRGDEDIETRSLKF